MTSFQDRRLRARASLPVLVAIAVVMIVAAILGVRALKDPSPDISFTETADQRADPRPETAGPDSRSFRDPARPARTQPAPVDGPRSRPAPPPRQDLPEGPVGIHAFPPLGTNPPLAGIIVPDDFELPPGYVRHYQTSDDGQMLEPILMYHPTRPPVDEHGQPLPIPADRVVPPELAPEGLPINMLEPPETREDEPIGLRRLLGPG